MTYVKFPLPGLIIVHWFLLRNRVFSFSLPQQSLTFVASPRVSRYYVSTREDMNYYGGSESSKIIREFSTYDQLAQLVSLASKPLPQRPDGVVVVAKYTSAGQSACRDTEAGYERLARAHPDSLFLRCFEEYENADLLMAQAGLANGSQNLPIFDVFFGNNRVGRVEGAQYDQVEDFVKKYGYIVSKLDLFSDDAQNVWGGGNNQRQSASKTPRTTARFLPGYDWDTEKGFFDTQADKAMTDFESTYENWMPNMDDE